MVALRYKPTPLCLQMGSLNNDGTPTDASVAGNSLILPGKMVATAEHTIDTEETTISSTCGDDEVEKTQTASVDFTFCEYVRAEVMNFLLGTPIVAASPELAAATDFLTAGDSVGWVAPPLAGAGSGCCGSTGASAAGSYIAAWRCPQQCGGRGIDGAYGFQLLGNIKSFTLTDAPLDWDSTTDDFGTWTIQAELGNFKPADFGGVFPGFADVADVDTQTWGGTWLTDITPPCGTDCSCSNPVLDANDDADRAVAMGT